MIIDQTDDPTGSKLEICGNHFGAWLPNGLFLTSGGVDKSKNNTAITLPPQTVIYRLNRLALLFTKN